MDDESKLLSFDPRSGAQTSAPTCPACGVKVPPDSAVCPVDGTPLMQELAPGAIIMGRFQLLKLLGSGGMGAVYKVKQMVLDKEFAIKFLTAGKVDEKASQRFSREAKAVSRLNHPNIVRVYDVGVTERGSPFMIMDLVEGTTLADVLKKVVQMPVKRAVRIFIQICDAMAHAHDQNVLHRDLKPGNIMLTVDDEGQESIRILDFGIAKLVQEPGTSNLTLTATGEVMGSPVYMSPEQGTGMGIDHRSDIYSLGCLMFEALAGTPPLHGSTLVSTMMMHQNTIPPRMSEASMGITFPEELEEIVKRCLAKNPADRFQSMTELKDALTKFQGGIRAPVIVKEEADKNWTGRSYSLKQVALISTLCASVAVCLAYFFVKWVDGPNKQVVSQVPAETPNILAMTSEEQDSVFIPQIQAACSNPSGDKKLNLEGAELSDKVWSLLKNLGTLESLILSTSNFGDDQCRYIGDLKTEHLELGQTNISNKALEIIGRMRGLKWLDLSDCKNITDSGLKYLAPAHTLRDLDLTGSSIFGFGLEDLKDCSKLVDINVKASPNLKATAFAGLEKLPWLRRLEASGTNFDDESASHLATLKELEWVVLKGTHITDKAIDYLIQLPNLRILDISHNRLSAKAIAKLARVKSLRELSVQECGLGEIDQFELSKQFPIYIHVMTK
jgi:serine/threonine protein kinase